MHNGLLDAKSTEDEDDDSDVEEKRQQRMCFLNYQLLRNYSDLKYAKVRLEKAERNMQRANLKKEHIQAMLDASSNETLKLQLHNVELECQLRGRELDKALDIYFRYQEQKTQIEEEIDFLKKRNQTTDKEEAKTAYNLVVKQLNRRGM